MKTMDDARARVVSPAEARIGWRGVGVVRCLARMRVRCARRVMRDGVGRVCVVIVCACVVGVCDG